MFFLGCQMQKYALIESPYFTDDICRHNTFMHNFTVNGKEIRNKNICVL